MAKEIKLNKISVVEYMRDASQIGLVRQALNNEEIQNGSYSFKCINKNLFSRTYCMPTSLGSDVTVVVKNPFLPAFFSKILISGEEESCRWHEGTLDELAETMELNLGVVFQG